MDEGLSFLFSCLEGVVLECVEEGRAAARDDDACEARGGSQADDILKGGEACIVYRVFAWTVVAEIRKVLFLYVEIFPKLNFEPKIHA